MRREPSLDALSNEQAKVIIRQPTAEYRESRKAIAR